MKKKIGASAIIVLISTSLIAKEKNYLLECWDKQVKLEHNFLFLSYSESLNELEHSAVPWQQTNYTLEGAIWINHEKFTKSDTIHAGKENFFSKTQFDNSALLFQDYGKDKLSPITIEMFLDYQLTIARYSPIGLINYFIQTGANLDNDSDHKFAVYATIINKKKVKLFISKTDGLVYKSQVMGNDDLLGDVLTVFNYTQYSTSNNLFYPQLISIEKFNGKVKDEVRIKSSDFVDHIPTLLIKPGDYSLTPKSETLSEISVSKYSDHIYFIELKNLQSRTLLVEFSDFLLIGEAPLNSKNGELIINEAKKIAPNKPIKYFSFSHHHPYPLGGIRAFISIGSQIICPEQDVEYITYLANATHSLNPDVLQLNPKPLILETMKDSLTISDGKYVMKIYLIGKKSNHTNDFSIYYFPSEKMVFESDLVWIRKKDEIMKAGRRQAGLYNAIKELNLNVSMIIQSWPIGEKDLKSEIPFDDLEKSMSVN